MSHQSQQPIDTKSCSPANPNLKLGTPNLKDDIYRHILSTMGADPCKPNRYCSFTGLAFSVRERLIQHWIETQRACYDNLAKRVYYLSLEFLPGRFLKNYLISLGMEEEAEQTLSAMGFDLNDIEEEEWDAGLGNGGLGRLASCYMDSMARLRLPGYGYGIRYDYGIFHQVIKNGYQTEESDNWMRRGNPWEIKRRDSLYRISFFGRSETYTDDKGRLRHRWVGTENVMAMPCDIFIPGYKDRKENYGSDVNDKSDADDRSDPCFVTNMRLWVAKSSREFDLEDFNQGNYIGAVENKVTSETISKVLYPNDEKEKGRELRLRQQYFFVSATIQDIFRRYKKQNYKFTSFPDFVAIQLNDTHPSIAIPELMRLLIDEEGLEWHEAWDICVKTFAYTNHTVLPEALETWSVDMIGRILPRHLEIIFEINRSFLEDLKKQFPNQPELESQMSVIKDGDRKLVRMAHLAIIGSHSVNGVAELHTRIIKQGMFKSFDKMFPGRIRNITNGVTPRRWIYQVNPALSELISSAIGSEWIDGQDLEQLKKLIPLADDPKFRIEWMAVKHANKKRLAHYILRKTGLMVNANTLFDVHVKRIHEYKRQLLNVLHVITLYNRIKSGSEQFSGVPRTVIFAGKAAPAYVQAKLIIKLINSIGEKINRDSQIQKFLRVIFLPNYCISQAEKVIPAADLSEQISTAGMEASGTGNMKFAMNGALTIGTLDGANVEIMQEVGKDNIFIFGLESDAVSSIRDKGYNSRKIYEDDPELKKTLDMISSGFFSPENPDLFAPIIRSLLDQGDFYMLLADYRSYIEAQEAVSAAYKNQHDWARRSILNTANMGKFSSDRAVLQYANEIWNISPLKD
ncbi:MAG: glycogen/starch/alpha-glucan phosphorylase [Desulfamplus sp.]|nr:glycogen/starch/alpha-glucan phosphorylase [Desulfamplus sp.]